MTIANWPMSKTVPFTGGGGGGGNPARRHPVIPSAIFGMLIFVTTEVMFFLSLISAYLVLRAGMPGGWVPPEGVRLPVLATAFNTLVLLASGVVLFLAGRAFKTPGRYERAVSLYLTSVLLGAFFVVFQGYEWVNLIMHGMTLRSGIFGATFYLIIGSHGLHAAAAIIAMAVLYRKLTARQLSFEGLTAMQIFWYFVVGVWPVLYGLVYF